MRLRLINRRKRIIPMRAQDADTMRAALDLIARLHGRRGDGTCTCDTGGHIRHDDCPTAIAIRHAWRLFEEEAS